MEPSILSMTDMPTPDTGTRASFETPASDASTVLSPIRGPIVGAPWAHRPGPMSPGTGPPPGAEPFIHIDATGLSYHPLDASNVFEQLVQDSTAAQQQQVADGSDDDGFGPAPAGAQSYGELYPEIFGPSQA